MADGRMVRAADVQALLGAVGELYACDRTDMLPAVTVGAARRLIAADVVGYNQVDPLVEHCPYWIEPHVPEAMTHAPALEAHLTEHPRMVDFLATGEPVARATSDYMSAGEWEGTAIFNEFYRHWDSRDQLILLAGLATRPGWSVGVVYSREHRGFSDRDRAVLELLHPHVLAAHRNCEIVGGLRDEAKALLSGADAGGAAIVVVDRAARVRAVTVPADRMLRAHFPAWSRRPGGALPTRLARWALPHLHPPTDAPPAVLHERTAPTADDARGPRVTAAKLPPRLRQVLDGLLAGESEKQIALRIDISPHTVHDHVKRLYRTLGVNGRGELLSLFVVK